MLMLRSRKIIQKKSKINKKSIISNKLLFNIRGSESKSKLKDINKSKMSLLKRKSISYKDEYINKNKINKKSNLNNLSSAYNLKKKRAKEYEKLCGKLTEQELNTLEYLLAVEIDKRSYCQYYISLLKKKQLILFTFLPILDYNLLTIKISLFIMSFTLSFTINGFFFTDETMHNVYKANGFFDFLYQIQQILYSTIICAIINLILKELSLSERNILEIKKEIKYKKAINKSKMIIKRIKLKFLIFFIVSTILLIFCWYFISCFCIVYNNTQIILLEDTLISFGLSMIYPFGLNLLPGIFRIPALKAKNKICLYKFSLLIAHI